MAKTQKDEAILAIARELNWVPWCDEYEKMISGMNYDQFNPDIFKTQLRTRGLSYDFNNRDPRMEGYVERQTETLQDILGRFGHGTYIRAPFTPDVGSNIVFGSNCFANFKLRNPPSFFFVFLSNQTDLPPSCHHLQSSLMILDTSLVMIGDRVIFGPNVSLITSTYDISVLSRVKFVTYGLPIRIENDCNIGANVTVLPGVTIGRGTTIEVGSVVTKDIPEYSIAVGNPARVVGKVKTEEEEREDPENPYRELP
ncbi:trimeric LpxA-like protein [Marasmius fiardii PR-910]|nr:trimeric LpxA-like protein [Marasmius fiardii PR-910]